MAIKNLVQDVLGLSDDFNLSYCNEILRNMKWPEDTKIHAVTMN